jgi:hypothetical protein
VKPIRRGAYALLAVLSLIMMALVFPSTAHASSDYVGYPQIAPFMSAADPWDNRCPYLYNGSTYWGNAQGAESVISILDAQIAHTVSDVRSLKLDNQRLHFVDVNSSSSSFVGHGICDSGSSDFQNFDQVVNGLSYVFHPNAAGQLAFTNEVANAITGGIG